MEGQRMKKKSKIVICILCILILTGCGKKEQEVVEITLIHGWGAAEEEHERMREIYEDFEKTHPNIRLNLNSMTSPQEVVSKVRNMLSVGEVPDLVFMGGYGKDSVYDFMVKKEKALDLMPYIQADDEFKKNVAPEIISCWEEQNHLYTVSDVLLPAGGYWYNEEIFNQAGIKEIPQSWTEFLDVCDKIMDWSSRTQSEVIPIQITQENSAYLADALFLEEGTNKSVIENLTYEKFLEAIQLMKKIDSYDAQSGKQYGYRDAGAMFNDEKAAMYINGAWAGKLISEKLNVKYAPFPGTDRKTSACLSACNGYIVGNTGNEEKMQASIEFIKYILSEEVQKRILKETGQMPSNPRICLEDYQEEEPRLHQAVTSIRGAKRKLEVPSNQWPTLQLQYFQENIFNVLQNKLSEEEFFQGLMEKEKNS